MIEGGWSYIWAAYAATLACVGGLALVAALRLRFWAKQARALDEAKRK